MQNRIVYLAQLAVACLLLHSSTASAEDIDPPSDDLEDYLEHGTSVATDGNRLIVGAPNADVGTETDAGVAYVYVYGRTWVLEDTLYHTTTQDANDHCGTSVDIDGNYAIVGCPDASPNSTSNAGRAYVYYYDGRAWARQYILTPSDAGVGDEFGTSVAISGDAAIVGAPYWDGGETNQGCAYYFTRNSSTWTERVSASETAANANFGFAVDIDGSYVIVGAPGEDMAEIAKPSQLWYWTWNSKKEIDGGTYTQTGSDFGHSVAISGSFAIVGSPLEDINGVPPDEWTDNGAAYIFYALKSGDLWGEVEYLPGGFQDYEHFGWSVDIDNSSSGDHYAIVGAPDDYYSGYGNIGSAEVFYRSSDTYWPSDSKLWGSPASCAEECGSSVGIWKGSSSQHGLFGCPGVDTLNHTDVGSADLESL